MTWGYKPPFDADLALALTTENTQKGLPAMKIEDLPPAQNADEIAKYVDLLLADKDTLEAEKWPFLTGYCAGIIYAAGKYQDGSPEDITGELLARMAAFE